MDVKSAPIQCVNPAEDSPRRDIKPFRSVHAFIVREVEEGIDQCQAFYMKFPGLGMKSPYKAKIVGIYEKLSAIRAARVLVLKNFFEICKTDKPLVVFNDKHTLRCAIGLCPSSMTKAIGARNKRNY